MTYSIERLTDDVMRRLGENSRPPSASDTIPGIPTVKSRIEGKVSALLPEIGSELLQEASLSLLSGGEPHRATATRRKLPCGLYAALLPLPGDFIRLASLKMESWQMAIGSAIGSDSGEWTRHLAKDAGVAGCMSRPMAYLHSGDSGPELMAVGSESQSDPLEKCLIWRMPVPDAEGNFRFPEALYPQLTAKIAAAMTT